LLKLKRCFIISPCITLPKSFTGLSTTMDGALSCPERLIKPAIKHIHIAEQNRFISAPGENRQIVDALYAQASCASIPAGYFECGSFLPLWLREASLRTLRAMPG
jgi:hypothetical protein